MSKENGLGLYKELDLNSTSNDERLKDVYQEWACHYDHDNDAVLGTVSQPNCVKLLASVLTDKKAAIIDVGCGTGLVGAYLHKSGFLNYDGIDLSSPMIAQAADRGYQNLLIGSLNDHLPIKDNAYDAALCVGVFTHGHVSANGLNELVRITKSGGYICFTINEGIYDDYGFEAEMNALTNAGKWHILQMSKDAYMTKKEVDGFYCLAKIL